MYYINIWAYNVNVHTIDLELGHTVQATEYIYIYIYHGNVYNVMYCNNVMVWDSGC